jgi:hypothetical protein
MVDDSNPHHEDDGRSHAVSWWSGICIFLLVYILSPPPLALMFERFGWESPDWPEYVYTPIIFLYEQFEPVKNFYDGYGKLLGVKHL